MGNYFSNIILFFYNKTKYKMNHISNFKDKLIMKPKDAHKLSKEEYREEVFKEKAKVTCQFIILVILSAIFAGIFYTFQTLQHSPQVAAATPAAAAASVAPVVAPAAAASTKLPA